MPERVEHQSLEKGEKRFVFVGKEQVSGTAKVEKSEPSPMSFMVKHKWPDPISVRQHS